MDAILEQMRRDWPKAMARLQARDGYTDEDVADESRAVKEAVARGDVEWLKCMARWLGELATRNRQGAGQ